MELGGWWLNRFNLIRNASNPQGTLTTVDFGGAGQSEYADDPNNLRFNQHEVSYSGLVGLSLDLSWSRLRFNLTADTGELKVPALAHYTPQPVCDETSFDPRCGVTSNAAVFTDELYSHYFIRQAYFELSLGETQWLQIAAGKRLISTGEGFVMDNHALGVELNADFFLGFDRPLRMQTALLMPDGSFTGDGKRSPYGYQEVAYLRSLLEEIGLFFAWYRDGNSELAEIARSILSSAAAASGNQGDVLYWVINSPKTEFDTTGHLFWSGLTANALFQRASLSITGIAEWGRFDYSISGEDPRNGEHWSRTGRTDCRGWMLDADAYFDVTDRFVLGGFLLIMSGEIYGPEELSHRQVLERLNSFVSIYPFITRTNLFFSGGMNQQYGARSLTTSGVGGRGVITPGLSAGLEILPEMDLRLVSALLLAHGKHLASNSRFYGVEFNLNFAWQFGRYCRLSVEADYLVTGGFFDFAKPFELSNQFQVMSVEPSTFQLIAGFDVDY